MNIILNNATLSFLYNKIKTINIVFVFVAGMSIEDIVFKVFDKECELFQSLKSKKYNSMRNIIENRELSNFSIISITSEN